MPKKFHDEQKSTFQIKTGSMQNARAGIQLGSAGISLSFVNGLTSANQEKVGASRPSLKSGLLELPLPTWFQPWLQLPAICQWLPNPQPIQISLLRLQLMVLTQYWRYSSLGRPTDSPAITKCNSSTSLWNLLLQQCFVVQELVSSSTHSRNLGAIHNCFPASCLMINKCQGSVDSNYLLRSSFLTLSTYVQL